MSKLLSVTQPNKKRKAISLETKYEIIEKSSKGVKTSELAEQYEKSTSTISTILKEKEKIIKEYEENRAGERKRIKLSQYPLLEEAMSWWFKKTNANKNIVIDGPTIQGQAEKYATFFSYTDFKASSGWVENFKKRNISFKTVVGEAGLVDNNVVDNWLKNILPKLIKGYNARDIFNADETALFFRALPTKTLTYKNLDANSLYSSKSICSC